MTKNAWVNFVLTLITLIKAQAIISAQGIEQDFLSIT